MIFLTWKYRYSSSEIWVSNSIAYRRNQINILMVKVKWMKKWTVNKQVLLQECTWHYQMSPMLTGQGSPRNMFVTSNTPNITYTVYQNKASIFIILLECSIAGIHVTYQDFESKFWLLKKIVALFVFAEFSWRGWFRKKKGLHSNITRWCLY